MDNCPFYTTISFMNLLLGIVTFALCWTGIVFADSSTILKAGSLPDMTYFKVQTLRATEHRLKKFSVRGSIAIQCDATVKAPDLKSAARISNTT